MLLGFVAIFAVLAIACNSKSDDDENDIAVTPALVAVKNFSLNANKDVLANLDSVFFSIDLKNGVIFNADSLPKGTNVSKLVPSIVFANTMTKAELSFITEDETTTSNYLSNPSDTIDFTYPVTLAVTAQDGINSFTYTIKVNVHQQDPDTIVWTNLEFSSLPSRNPRPVAQKTIQREDVTYCLIEEYDGSYTLSSTSNLYEGEWEKENFEPGFMPAVESFTATADSFYLTDVNGELYTTLNLKDWTDTSEKWLTILGAYGQTVLGIKQSGDIFLHTQDPLQEGFEEKEVSEGFPVTNSTSLGVIESEWADKPLAILACGLTGDGVLSSDVWCYDGSEWAIINENVLPALDTPMLTRYVVYRSTPQVFHKKEFDVWLLFGGINTDGDMNRRMFMSYDNGVHWALAPSGMQLPEMFPTLSGASLIVADYPLSADLADAWTSMTLGTRSSYTIDGTEITWMCPYMYIFGGYYPAPNNSLNTNIYRGVLERLKFTPII